MARPWLVVAGSGIRPGGQLTPEARVWIERAGQVLHLLTEPFAEAQVAELNPRARSLRPLYQRGKDRVVTYEQMVQALLDPLRFGESVCAVFYGHPGVFAFPGHEAIRRARAAGFEARMLPGISAEDCLFADLLVDPARGGCQSYEATYFLVRPRAVEPTAGLLLWQVGAIGVMDYPRPQPNRRGLELLSDALVPLYGREHEVIVYDASSLVGVEHSAAPVALGRLAQGPVTTRSTLYVPPLEAPPYQPERLRALGIARLRSDEELEEVELPDAFKAGAARPAGPARRAARPAARRRR